MPSAGAHSSSSSFNKKMYVPSLPFVREFLPGLFYLLIPNPPQTDPQTELPIPAHADTLWEVEVKTAQPIRDTPVHQAIDVLLEFQGLMKGLLDLRRQDM